MNLPLTPAHTDPVLAKQNVANYLPHREPMILIDRILAYCDDNLLSETVISPSSAYFDAATQQVPNYVGIEYMAQTIAALAGVEAKANNLPICIGFLLGSRKLEMHINGFELGASYFTRVTRLYQEDTGLAVFDCQILHKDQVVASANVNVFQPQDAQAYISQSIQ